MDEILEHDESNLPETTRAVELIRTLHRRDDAFIAFGHKMDGVWRNLASLRPSQLTCRIPQIGSDLSRDGYFGVNSMYRASRTTNPKTQLPDAYRNNHSVRYINACYVDLDCGRPDGDKPENRKPAAQVALEIFELVNCRQLPNYSMFVRSGRGCYLLWILHDAHDKTSPPPGYPTNLALYERVNRALIGRLKEQAADPICDPARVLRVPFSINTVAAAATGRAGDGKVFYYVNRDGDGDPISYSLDDLAEELGICTGDEVDINEAERTFARDLATGTSNQTSPEGAPVPARVNGARKRSLYRLEDMQKIEKEFGGWKKGCRRRNLTLYAELHRNANLGWTDTFDNLRIMAANCNPAYPSDRNDVSVPKIVVGVQTDRYKRHSRAILCEQLGVTDEIARRLELRSIITDVVRQERTLPHGGQRAQDRIDRYRILKMFLANGGAPSARKVQAAYKEAGVNVSHLTANADLKAIGLAARKVRLGRPRRSFESESAL